MEQEGVQVATDNVGKAGAQVVVQLSTARAPLRVAPYDDAAVQKNTKPVTRRNFGQVLDQAAV